MTWRDSAKKTIALALEEIRDRLPEMTIKEIRVHINRAYPFGERAHYPYQVWLDELSIVLNRLEGSRNAIQYPQGELNLFTINETNDAP